MEQHRVLIIIVSVAVVLAAIVGIGLWLYYPRAEEPADTALTDAPQSGGFEWQPSDFLQGDGDPPELITEDTQDETSTEFEVTYGVREDQETGPDAERVSQPLVTTVDEREPPDSDEQPAVTQQPVEVVEVPPAATVVEATSGVGTTSGRAPAPAATVAPPPVPLPADTRQLAEKAYWIQAISSPNRDTVEQARLTLRDHQLGSRILTREIDGTTYYRLRVGPFTVRAEAEKFQGWVRDIDDFADAMIFVDYTTPVIAANQ